MDIYEIQRKVFRTIAVLLIVSALALIAVIPAIFQDTSPDADPKRAAIGTLVGVAIHLLVCLGYLNGIKKTKRKARMNNEVNLVYGAGLIVLGFVIMDGVAAFWNQMRFVSIGMSVCVLSDFAAGLVSLTGFFIIRRRKRK